jgi:predicted DNA-binding protein (UPF0251 family)
MASEPQTPAERFGPEQQMPASEKIFTLSELGMLTERQAEAYVYRRIEKLDREETAAEMDVSTSTVDDYERAAADKLTNSEETINRLFDLGWWQGPLTVVYGFGTDKAKERFTNEIISAAPDAEIFVMCDYPKVIQNTLNSMFDDAVADELDVSEIRSELPEEWLSKQVDNGDESPVPYENIARIIEEHSELITAAHLGPPVDPRGPEQDEVVLAEPPISGSSMNALSGAFAVYINNRIQQPKRGVILARGDSRLKNHLVSAISSQLRVDWYDESREDIKPHPLAGVPTRVTD